MSFGYSTPHGVTGIEGSAQWSLRRDSGTDQRRSQNKKARRLGRAFEIEDIVSKPIVEVTRFYAGVKSFS